MHTLADFYSSGDWDCSHAYDADSHYDAWRALGRPTDPEAAINVVRKAWPDDYCPHWVEQNADEIAESGLHPVACFEAWADGWQARAVRIVRGDMADWWRDYVIDSCVCSVERDNCETYPCVSVKGADK